MRVVFIGGGTMAQSIISGVIGHNLLTPSDLLVSEPIEDRRAQLSQRHGVAVISDNRQAVSNGDFVVLAVKPQDLAQVLEEIRGVLNPEQVLVSVVAGVRIGTLVQGTGHEVVVRVMSNIPAQVGAAMSVWSATSQVNQQQTDQIRSLLQAIGEELYVVDERYLDMATALSASGPAYIFLFLEALIDAGVQVGLPRQVSRTLAVQTLLGSGLIARESGKHPGELKEMVASPGGTTVDGLLALEEGGVPAAVMKAVLAAYKKSQVLGELK